jgi:hypothetical protein
MPPLPVHADAVQVGVFLTSDRKLAEPRPRTRWLSCFFYASHEIDDRLEEAFDEATD